MVHVLSQDQGRDSLDLAREPDFAIATLIVRPPACEVEIAGETQKLEPRVMQVLVALAQAKGAVVSRDDLIQICWGGIVVGDDAINRVVGRVRKLSELGPQPAFKLETIPKIGYRLMPLGADTTTVAPAETPRGFQPTRRHWIMAGGGAAAVIAAAIILVVFAGGERVLTVRPPDYLPDLVALRPIRVIDAKPGMEAFAQKLHASLKRILTSNQILVVEEAAKRLPQAVAVPNSEFALSGSLEPADGAYTVTVYFDDRASRQTLWSQRLTRAAAEEEGLREAVGVTAADIISCSLRQRAKAPRKPSVQAFMIYLELCDWKKTWSDNGETALVTAERLVAIAPDDPYGHGFAALANSLLAKDRSDFTPAQIEFYTGAARRAAARALALDPKNDDALMATALVGPPLQYWLGLDAFGERQAWSQAWGLRKSGRVKEALHLQSKQIASTPLSLGERVGAAGMAIQAGYHEEADRELADILRLQPDHQGGLWNRFQNAAFYGDPKRALALLDADFSAWEAPERSCWRAFLEARAKRPDHARVQTVRAACAESYRTGDDSLRDRFRRMLATLGDIDGVFELMQTKRWSWAGGTIMLWYPEMAAVRRDARFMPLIVQTGLPEYWLKSGHWPDFCQDDLLPYDCKEAAARALKGAK